MTDEERAIAMIFLEIIGAGMILALIILGIAKYSEFFKPAKRRK